MFGLGGELSKEGDFVFILLYYFVQSHFVMFSGLMGSLFYKAVIPYSLLFQNPDPFCNQNFVCFS